ncbi:MAG TPA: DNA topoisomerase IV subunit A [Rhodocyclaceae bacterium]|nr:DNA topoisomerase IV subunit A [Rhodocyclaceae bacterium]
MSAKNPANPTGDLFADLDSEADETPALSVPSAPTFADGTALSLDAYAERAYLSYAMSVVRARALPQVEDGLKPVQRRILHAMNEMRLSATSKHVKSARVVGDVIGKFHPHGDTSVYDAMVRVAQDFTLRYPLVDGQGNFGSRDGDGAAAMRYTECRLTPIAELLLGEIDRGTVDFLPNYDGSTTEPQLMPARLPFVLLNGASGIAVGMATEIPPHNLREVAAAVCHVIQHPDAGLDEVMAILPGPDFPGGGQLISAPQDIREIYAGGRGSLRLRARWKIEELARGQWRVVVHELPHGVSVAQVLSEIETLTNPQPRAGKKEVSHEQKNLKALVLSVLDTVRDESSDQQAVRIVLEPKSSRISQDEFMAVLLTHTRLEAGVSVNLTMVGRPDPAQPGYGGRPQQKNLLQILREWIDFRYVTVERRTRHRLGEVDRRLHILAGRQIVFLHIDEVIRCIRESDEPKSALMQRFGLSEIQAEDILEIRLRQLARLEGFRIEQEIKELQSERAGLILLLESRPAMTKQILKEIGEDAKRFGDARRTLIEAVAQTLSGEINAPDEPVTVIVSKNGWVRTRQGHGLDANAIAYKTGDYPWRVLESRTVWPLIIVDHQGRSYSVKVSDLPGGRGDGTPLNTLIDFFEGGKPAQVLTGPGESKYLMSGSGGYGFVVGIAETISRNKAGKAFMSLEKGEKPLLPLAVSGDSLAVLTQSGRLLLFGVDEIKAMAKGRGSMLIGLAEGDEIVGMVMTTAGQALQIGGVGRGGKTSVHKLDAAAQSAYRAARGKRGKEIPFKIKPTELSVVG